MYIGTDVCLYITLGYFQSNIWDIFSAFFLIKKFQMYCMMCWWLFLATLLRPSRLLSGFWSFVWARLCSRFTKSTLPEMWLFSSSLSYRSVWRKLQQLLLDLVRSRHHVILISCVWLHCNAPGDCVWVSAGPQWEETYSFLGESVPCMKMHFCTQSQQKQLFRVPCM